MERIKEKQESNLNNQKIIIAWAQRKHNRSDRIEASVRHYVINLDLIQKIHQLLLYSLLLGFESHLFL